ncbi:MAG: tRNA (N6-isopentenyl adenosine(37)-C2)-methylthiotransferase MiaB [Parcubacteria group bacterium]|jgi:tRNA-2-methylthio-N6-dimethylallyladenosine synthase
MTKYYIKIFGCQMNQSDGERITTYLEKYKIEPAASIDAADLVVFVTCGVRQAAEDRVYGLIHNINRKYPKKKIVLTGCLAHQKDVRRRLKGKVTLFCEIKNFPEEIKKILNAKYRMPDTKNKLCKDYLEIIPKHSNRHTALVPIMTGCNNFCAYCVVPYARGREYSRPAEDILKEIKRLIKKDYKEIVLLGQNVNSYKSQKVNFPKLLQLIEKIPGKFWLTFLTSHPKDMSSKLIETIAKSKKICEYISLPAQSGDNDILKKMNRKYTVGHYESLIKKIRKAYKGIKSPTEDLIPSPAISTDIIVGFPGETKKQFENTARLLREMKFDMAYIAQYSPRPETAAWKLRDNVSKSEKARRQKVLTDILKKTALENNKKYIGKAVEVLVDKELEKNAKGLPAKALAAAGHTRTQKKVIFSANKKIPIGDFAKVKITKVKAFGLEGTIV